MHLNFKYISMIAASAVLIGCGGGGGSSAPAGGSNLSGNTNTTDTAEPVFKTTEDYTIPENKRYIHDTQADDDQSEVSYSIVSGTDKDNFSIDKHNGTLIFKSAPDFENPKDLDRDNIYEVTIQATDVSGNKRKQDITITINDTNESIPKSYTFASLKNGSNNYDVGTKPKDVYILFTNMSKSTESTPNVSHNKLVSSPESKKVVITNYMFEQAGIMHTPAYIQVFNSKVKTLLQKNNNTTYQAKNIAIASKSNKSVGDSEIFYMDAESTGAKTTATLKKVVSSVSTVFGSKTLNVWVENDSFGNGCEKVKCVTQDMVDALANTFLKIGDDNDIYDWVTNIYGEEWGETEYSQLITANDEITILLTDIGNDDNPTGGVIGYFYPKDNIVKSEQSGSNERIMFYADSVMFANTDNDGFWQKEMYSTLAHEFQHMIHFYQKNVLLDTDTDVWINEMLSEATEDLIATKIEHTGPRGVDYADGSAGRAGNTNGRYPLFNQNNTLSLTAWNNSLADYSKVNAFGTFLTRNYGGAEVLHDIVHNSLLHEDSIMDAVHKTPQGAGKTFDDLLKEWGVAVMLSNRIDTKRNQYSYNTDDFTVNEKSGIIYKMGAINYFNYDPKPNISTTIGTIKPQGNYYYKVGDNLTGIVTIDLTLNGTTEATLIAK